jgi:hypothetical protein
MRALLLLSMVSLVIATGDLGAQPTPAERVTGIGGFFFKATDPKALAE